MGEDARQQFLASVADGGALGIAKRAVLFYAVEALVNRSESHVLRVRVAASVLLAGLVARVTL